MMRTYWTHRPIRRSGGGIPSRRCVVRAYYFFHKFLRSFFFGLKLGTLAAVSFFALLFAVLRFRMGW